MIYESEEKMSQSIQPPITYFGSKSRLARQITRYFPTHTTFVDVFGGSGAVLLNKRASKVEVYNDINKNLTCLFKVLSDKTKTKKLIEELESTLYSRYEFQDAKATISSEKDEIQIAKKMIVIHRQSFAGIGQSWSYSIEDSTKNYSSSVRRFHAGIERLQLVHERLRKVQIENLHFSQLIQRYDRPQTLFYLDPPYLHETRISGGYEQEMSLEEHQLMIDVLQESKSMFVLSGYQNTLYQQLEDNNFRRIDIDTIAHSSEKRNQRVESIWISPNCTKNINNELTAKQRAIYQLHQDRKAQTTEDILNAISFLKRKQQRITKTAVAKLTGLSREHIGRYYSQLFDRIIK